MYPSIAMSGTQFIPPPPPPPTPAYTLFPFGFNSQLEIPIICFIFFYYYFVQVFRQFHKLSIISDSTGVLIAQNVGNF